MKHSKSQQKLSKLLAYVLGYRPDEFGLIPDANGYVKIKELLKALGEEEGWRHIRMNHVREVCHALASPSIEIEGNHIRAKDRSRLPQPQKPDSLPKLLYHAIRQRAHPVVLEKGVRPFPPVSQIVLTTDEDFAKRLGKRIDPAPVILTVNTHQAQEKGVTLEEYGSRLFLADGLPVGCFACPPLPKREPEPKKTEPIPQVAKTPGSFFLDLTEDPDAKRRDTKKTKKWKNEWKRERKRRNRSKGFP